MVVSKAVFSAMGSLTVVYRSLLPKKNNVQTVTSRQFVGSDLIH
jgi:hypothetical protein